MPQFTARDGVRLHDEEAGEGTPAVFAHEYDPARHGQDLARDMIARMDALRIDNTQPSTAGHALRMREVQAKRSSLLALEAGFIAAPAGPFANAEAGRWLAHKPS
jgi:hypothetical protein